MAHSAEQPLGTLVRRGLAWSGLSTIVLKLGGLLVSIVAARLLAPAEFGVFAIALVVHAVVLNVSDVGVSAYLVRHQGDISKIAPTVLTIALTTSAGLAAAMALTAPLIAELLGSSAATGPVRVLSLTVLLAGWSAVPNALLIRDFRQRSRFAAEGLGFLASSGVLVALALAGGGAMALAYSRVAGHVVTTIVFLIAVPILVRPGFDGRQVRGLLRFGLPLVGNTLVGFVLLNIDYIVIGRLLGAEPLGHYYLGFNIASWPFMIISPILGSVAIAAFSRLRSDPQQFERSVHTALRLLLVVSVPTSLFLAALAEPLIEAVYGAKWAAAAGALAFTAVYGAFRVPVDLFSNLAITVGRTRSLLFSQLLYGTALAPLTILLVGTQGIAGAGQAHVLAIALVLLPALVLVSVRGTGVSVPSLVKTAGPPVTAGAAAALVAHVVAEALAPTSGPWMTLLVGGASGATVYLALMWRSLKRLRQTLSPAAAEQTTSHADRAVVIPAPAAEPPEPAAAVARGA